MAVIDALFAQWLQSPQLSVVAEDDAVQARWGDTALTVERSTTIADKAEAFAQADRIAQFRGVPLVEDVAELPGEFVSAIGQVITVTHTDLGYEDGIDVFVIAAADNRAAGTSRVNFLRRL